MISNRSRVESRRIHLFVSCGRWITAACAASLLLTCAPASYAADPQPVTDCSSEERFGDYYLTGDLDCTGSYGLTLHSPTATLDMRGFSIRNGLRAL